MVKGGGGRITKYTVIMTAGIMAIVILVIVGITLVSNLNSEFDAKLNSEFDASMHIAEVEKHVQVIWATEDIAKLCVDNYIFIASKSGIAQLLDLQNEPALCVFK